MEGRSILTQLIPFRGRPSFHYMLDSPSLYPSFVILKSVHNVVIFWHWLCEKTGSNLKDFILCGKQDSISQPNVNFLVRVYPCQIITEIMPSPLSVIYFIGFLSL